MIFSSLFVCFPSKMLSILRLIYQLLSYFIPSKKPSYRLRWWIFISILYLLSFCLTLWKPFLNILKLLLLFFSSHSLTISLTYFQLYLLCLTLFFFENLMLVSGIDLWFRWILHIHKISCIPESLPLWLSIHLNLWWFHHKLFWICDKNHHWREESF